MNLIRVMPAKGLDCLIPSHKADPTQHPCGNIDATLRRYAPHEVGNGVGTVTVEEFNRFCSSLAHTSHVVQWGGANVWKVADKVFAIGGWNDDDFLYVTFKCSDLSYNMLKEQPGLRPAPYLASRGMKWIQRTSPETLDDDGLKDYLRESYRLVSLNLTKKKQRELGLNQDAPRSETKRQSQSKTRRPTGKRQQARQHA